MILGWVLAVTGWLGVVLWYFTLLAGSRSGALDLGAVGSLAVAQVGRALLQAARV
ncbi:MAG TPA: hypothetical protein VFA18_25105 [Gemmataceae bacterium]|nr:hypothetical protein [Gemmataceae bacterium]